MGSAKDLCFVINYHKIVTNFNPLEGDNEYTNKNSNRSNM